MGVLLEDISPCASLAVGAKPGYLVHDNLDDRKEVFCLLARLSPATRLAWLEWACKQAVLAGSKGDGVRPTVSRRTRQLAQAARWDSAADARLTLEVFFDLWQISVSFHVNFDGLLRRLERQVRTARA